MSTTIARSWATRIYLPCNSDYDVDDCLEVENRQDPFGAKDKPLLAVDVIADGDTFYIVDDGKGLQQAMRMPAVTTWRACPTSKFLRHEGGSAITWDDSDAGEELLQRRSHRLTNYHHRWHGLQRLKRWHVAENVEFDQPATAGGRGGSATVTVDATVHSYWSSRSPRVVQAMPMATRFALRLTTVRALTL